jgi:single-stranded DNA-binding protein
MDLNLVVLAGRLVAPPRVTESASGARTVRYLVAVRSEHPHRRVDVIPVVYRPGGAPPPPPAEPGARVWIAAGLRRSFWDPLSGEETQRVRLEIVAHQIEVRPDDRDEAETRRPAEP